MATPNQICRLCFTNIEEEEAQIINDDVKELLQTLLHNIDLSISGNPVICKACHTKSEEVYNFKKKCMFTENSLSPFVAENVKLDLHLIRSNIIESEDTEFDKNVCRLCLQYVDVDVVINEAEKVQFQRFLPEINLDVTDFVIICTACYDLLQKYFDFVTSSSELEEQLCNYSLNFTEQNSGILENFQQFLKSGENQIEPQILLDEEMGITIGGDLNGEKYPDINVSDCTQANVCKRKNYDCKPENKRIIDRQLQAQLNDLIDIIFKCGKCQFVCNSAELLMKHTTSDHVIASVSTVLDQSSNFESTYANYLKSNMSTYVESPKATYRCRKCNYVSKTNSNMGDHILRKHATLPATKSFKCDHCDIQFNKKKQLVAHTKRKHWKTLECDKCSYKAKGPIDMGRHMLVQHSKSKNQKFKCDKCDFKCQSKYWLNQHIAVAHKEIDSKMYQCGECLSKFKDQSSLKFHLSIHSYGSHKNPTNVYKCEECHCESTEPLDDMHCTPTQNKIYRCQSCNHVTRCKYNLETHVKVVHTAHQSKTNMFQSQFLQYLNI